MIKLDKKGKVLAMFIGINIILAGAFVYLSKNPDKAVSSPIGSTFQVINAAFSSPPTRTVYGYLPYWALEEANYIQYDKLTDIAFFGLRLESDGNFQKVDDDDATEPGYNAWNNSLALKKVLEYAKIWKVRVALTLIAQNDEDIDTFLDCRECWNTALVNTETELTNAGIKDVNIGFEHSVPEADPQSGGAEINIDNTYYSFGSLAKSFYDSDELLIFPH